MRRDGGILPSLPRVLLAGDARGRPQARFTDLPQVFLLGLVVESFIDGRA